MEIKYKNICIYFDNLIIIVFILSIISEKLFCIFSCYLINYIFIFLHELSHCFIANLYGIKIKKINICLSGLFINLDNFNILNKNKKIIVLLAGPFCNFILFIILKKYFILSYINLVLCIFNLFPLRNFDGYNILKLFINDNNLTFISNIIFILLFIFNIILVVKFNVFFLSIILIYYYIQNIKK